MVNILFFEVLYIVGFCDEINFENLNKSSKQHQQGGNLKVHKRDKFFGSDFKFFTIW